MPTPVRPFVCLLLSSVALALAAGCSSEADRPAPPLAANVELAPIMAGTETFADGRITVKVTLAMPSNYHAGKEGSGPGGPGSGVQKIHHRGEQAGADAPRPPSEDNAPPRVVGSTLPPAQLKLYLSGSSAEVIKCEVTDFNSYLGNFAVYPSRYQIEPGQTVASEIMTSRLGVEGREIPLTVGVRVGDHTERKIVTLQALDSSPDAVK